jgi:hypothetical protein
MKRRDVFTDGWNSFWHVFFGILSIRFNIIIPIFIIYQLIHIYDKNLFIDISEFFIGIFGIYVFISVIKYNNQIKEYIQIYYQISPVPPPPTIPLLPIIHVEKNNK